MLRNKMLPLMCGRIHWAVSPVLGIMLTVAPSALVHAQTSNSPQDDSGWFASSSSGIAAEANPGSNPSSDATHETSSLTFAAPLLKAASPAAGGQAYQSYGSHDRGIFSHLTFEAGGGANAPIGNDAPVITWGGNFTGGVGYRLMKRVSLMAEYQFMDNKLPGGLIADAGAQGGHAHIWSLTLDPVIDLLPGKKNGVYVTGGGGFYRKVTSFTDPEEVEECYYFCYTGVENVVVSHFSSNQGGLNIGFGITHTLGSADTGSDGRLKAFAEARYVWINTPGVGTPDGLGTTGLIPVTLGIRW